MEPNEIIAYVFVALGVGSLGFTLVRHIRKTRTDAVLAEKRMRDERKKYHSLEGLMNDISAVVVEASQRADNKLIALERVLKHAAEREEKLEGLNHQAASLAPRMASATRVPELRIVQGEKTVQRSQVFNLADQGCTPTAIAQEVGLDHGEVELMLALRHRQREYGTTAGFKVTLKA